MIFSSSRPFCSPAISSLSKGDHNTESYGELGMDRERLEAKASDELKKHGLDGWTFRFANTKRRLGVCKYWAKRIEIAEYYALNSPDESVDATHFCTRLPTPSLARKLATAHPGKRGYSDWSNPPGLRQFPRYRCVATGRQRARGLRRPTAATSDRGR